MKNGALLTRFLDFCAEMIRARGTEAWFDLISDDSLWFALLDNGWTIPEIDTAYFRRFGVTVNRAESHPDCKVCGTIR